MKITRIETFAVPPRWVFCRVETDEGIVGWGEPVVEGRAETVRAAVAELSELLIGRDPRRIEQHWQVLTKGGFYRGGPVLSSAVAGLADAKVQLPVLAAADGLVEEADVFQHTAAHHAEIRGFRFTLVRAAVIGPAAETDGGVVCAGDGLLERGAPVRVHDTADVRRAGALQHRECAPSVPGRQLGVRVHAHDRPIAARADRGVQPDRDVGGRILDEADAVVIRGQPLRERGRAVARGPEGEDEL